MQRPFEGQVYKPVTHLLKGLSVPYNHVLIIAQKVPLGFSICLFLFLSVLRGPRGEDPDLQWAHILWKPQFFPGGHDSTAEPDTGEDPER